MSILNNEESSSNSESADPYEEMAQIREKKVLSNGERIEMLLDEWIKTKEGAGIRAAIDGHNKNGIAQAVIKKASSFRYTGNERYLAENINLIDPSSNISLAELAKMPLEIL